MATLTIRNVDEKTHKALRLRAAENGRSVEEEIRRILAEQAVAQPESRKPKTAEEIDAAVKALQAHFAPLRGKYSVDQFIREKRADARREAREFAESAKKFRK